MNVAEHQSIVSPEMAGELRERLSAGALLRPNEPLARRTTLRVGGPADLFVEPATEQDLARVLEWCAEQQVAWMVLGRGSNLLVRDGGIRGLVISLGNAGLSVIEVEQERIRAGAGARLRAIAFEAKKARLTGFEFMEGIPGNLGGGLRMNAGAMGSATFQVVESVRVMEPDGRIVELSTEEIPVQYRHCPLLKEKIAVSAVLSGRAAAKEFIEKRMNECSQKRWSSQPAAPSAGCIFKNSLTIPSGKLVEELGLKGTRRGGAVISEVHGNFIVNDQNASARDVIELIELIKEKAREQRGLELETEVQIVGEDLHG